MADSSRPAQKNRFKPTQRASNNYRFRVIRLVPRHRGGEVQTVGGHVLHQLRHGPAARRPFVEVIADQRVLQQLDGSVQRVKVLLALHVLVRGRVLNDSLERGLHPVRGRQQVPVGLGVHPAHARLKHRGRRDFFQVCAVLLEGVLLEDERPIELAAVRKNTIVGNSSAGIFFRNEAEAMGAHRNVFEDNQILDNGAAETGAAAYASIVVRGHHNDLVFRRNTIGQSGSASGPGFLVSKATQGLKSEENKFTNVKTEMVIADK
jgi:hypothetical protein